MPSYSTAVVETKVGNARNLRLLHVSPFRFWSVGTSWRIGAAGWLGEDSEVGLEVHLATDDARTCPSVAGWELRQVL